MVGGGKKVEEAKMRCGGAGVRRKDERLGKRGEETTKLILLDSLLQEKSPKWMDEGETFLKIQRTRLCNDNSKKVVLERGELKIRTRPDKADVWNP